MTFDQRAARIAQLERENDEACIAHERARARYEATQAALARAMTIYMDAVTAPLRAFAEELRR